MPFRRPKMALLSFVLALFVPGISSLAFPQTDVLPSAGNGGNLVVALNPDHPPYEYFESSKNEFGGFNVEILRALARLMESEIEYSPLGTAEGLAALREGSVDAMLGVPYSIERDGFLDFTSPICVVSSAIFVRKDRGDISGIVDLAGRTVAVQKGDFIGEILQNGKGMLLVSNDSYESALRMLDLGDVAAFVGSRDVARHAIDEHGLRNIMSAGPPFHQAGLSIAVREGNHDLVSRLESALVAIRQTGE